MNAFNIPPIDGSPFVMVTLRDRHGAVICEEIAAQILDCSRKEVTRHMDLSATLIRRAIMKRPSNIITHLTDATRYVKISSRLSRFNPCSNPEFATALSIVQRIAVNNSLVLDIDELTAHVSIDFSTEDNLYTYEGTWEEVAAAITKTHGPR